MSKKKKLKEILNDADRALLFIGNLMMHFKKDMKPEQLKFVQDSNKKLTERLIKNDGFKSN